MTHDLMEIADDISHEITHFNNLEGQSKPKRRKTNEIVYDDRESIYCWIENFVIAASNADRFPFWIEKLAFDRKKLHREPLVNFYPLMSQMMEACDVHFQYTPHIEAFIQVCDKLGFLDSGFRWSSDIYKKPKGYKLNFKELFNQLVYELKAYCESKPFIDAVENQRIQVRRRQMEVKNWEEKLFARRSRHLMIHLTLGYQSQYCDTVTPEIVHGHLRRFLHNRFMNDLLSGILDYALRIEDGPEVGLHVHLIIAYDGQSLRDQPIAKYICDYWINTITAGQGTANSDNFYKKNIHAKGWNDGTGQINHFDRSKRDGLLIALDYLCKGAQTVRKRAHKKVKTFSLSRPGDKLISGRPRKVV